MAVANYEDAKGHFPPAHVPGPDGQPWHSWRVLLLPYLEGDSLHRQYRFEEPWDGPNNRLFADRMPKVYAFSGTRLPTTTTNYLAVVGPETMWPGAAPRRRSEIKDDASRTILIVENQGLGVHWMEPRDLALATMDFRLQTAAGISSWYKQPAIVTVTDEVFRLSSGMSAGSLRAALTVSGGEQIGGQHGNWAVIPDGRDREKR